jgi:EF hand
MSIRGKTVLITLAITLIGAAPAWSQSLLKTLDTDNDGTIDLAEAKSAASKLFDKLDRDHDGTLDRRELRGRLNAKDFAAADPTTTELSTRMNFSRSSRNASRLPILTMTARLTPRSSREPQAVSSCRS